MQEHNTIKKGFRAYIKHCIRLRFTPQSLYLFVNWGLLSMIDEVGVLDCAVVDCLPLLWSGTTGFGDSFGYIDSL